MKVLRRVRRFVLVIAVCIPAGSLLLFAQRPPRDATKTVVIAVSPKGDDDNPGTVERPFRTPERAQQEVRLLSSDHDVVVQLADGVYRLDKPLRFAAEDGGQNGFTVSWGAANGAQPVFSGGIRVTGWKIFDAKKGIYIADTPRRLDSRQLWVDDQLAHVASMEIPRSAVEFSRRGLRIKDEKYAWLTKISDASRLEISQTGFFTKRFSPVDRVEGDTFVMKQPAWDNNLWGYDTISTPYHPELAHLFIANSLALLQRPGQWYLDPVQGHLYLKPPRGVDPQTMDVELPRLTVLVAVGNSLDAPIQDLSFRGIRFSHTSWLGPSTNEGYASQQSGSFLAGRALAYPEDPIKDCPFGCPAFESMRNEWKQTPAAVQVSAAQEISFKNCVFAHLGQYALGIGNDADATLSGTGLGAADVTITANVFTDLAGGAILVGGIQRAAHHPNDPRQIDRTILISNNRIRSVSRDYEDNSAILSTYVQQAIILHNDISDVPYDAIDTGYGWGIQDAGGNPNYRSRFRGYQWKQNLVYSTPTTLRDTVVAANRIHGAKQLFHDGGAIYNLSANPGSLITENYIFDNHSSTALYLDEGSRYVTVRRNVVRDSAGRWLNVNTVRAVYPVRVSPDNTASDNWHDSTNIGGIWTNYQNNLILDDHLIVDDNWPTDAETVMKNAGIEPSAGPVVYEDAKPGAGEDLPHGKSAPAILPD